MVEGPEHLAVVCLGACRRSAVLAEIFV